MRIVSRLFLPVVLIFLVLCSALHFHEQEHDIHTSTLETKCCVCYFSSYSKDRLITPYGVLKIQGPSCEIQDERIHYISHLYTFRISHTNSIRAPPLI